MSPRFGLDRFASFSAAYRRDDAVRCVFISEMRIGLVLSSNDEATRRGKSSHERVESQPGESFVTRYRVVRGYRFGDLGY